MQIKTILFLLLVVLGLGTLVWMQQEEAAADPDGFLDYGLFEGVDLDRIGIVQIEHIENYWQVRLESDARGSWYLTDPIAYRASDSFINQLLEQFRIARGIEVPNPGSLVQLGLDPPRAVITVSERSTLAPSESGQDEVLRRATVELGSIDLDGTTMYVRVGDRVLRAVRSLDNALAGSLRDFRSRRLTEVPLTERPIEITRTGSLTPGGDDLSFEALVDDSRWFATQPARVALDPLAVGLFATQLLGVRLTQFYSDSPGPLELYGLEEPLLKLELRTVRDNRVSIRFGHPPDDDETWLVKRDDYPFIWELNARDMRFFTTGFDDLFDYLIIRSNRSAINSIVLEGEGRALRLFKSGVEWRATENLEDEVESLTADDYLLVDAGKVGDMLALLERSEIAIFLERDQAFVPSEPRERLEVRNEDGLVFGGEFGISHAVQGGEAGRMFRRMDDVLVGLVSEELVELTKLTFESLRSLQIHKLEERAQRAVRLRRGEDDLVYSLDRKSNTWRSDGTTLESRDFSAVIDRLLSLRARRWLSLPEVPVDSADEIAIEIQADDRSLIEFRLSRGADGREFCQVGSLWAEIRPGLVKPVSALFGN